jgi:hypothetical protein
MEALKQNKRLLTAFGITLLITAGYYGYRYMSDNGEPGFVTTALDGSFSSDPADATALSDAQEIMTALRTLNGIKIDTEFFDEPAFTNLKDYSVTIPPITPGRRNPFTPLSGAVLSDTNRRI